MRLYCPDDFPIIEEILKRRQLQCPVLIQADEPVINIRFSLDYDYHDDEIAAHIEPNFPGYEFVDNVEIAITPVRISYHYTQHYGDPDKWGRPIENPIRQKLYLVKKSEPVQKKLNPGIKVVTHFEI